jgi:hypothetical protein
MTHQNVRKTENTKQEILRLEHRFTMSDLEELKAAFGVSFIP